MGLPPVNMTNATLHAGMRDSLLTVCNAISASLPLSRSATKRSICLAVSQSTPRPTSISCCGAFDGCSCAFDGRQSNVRSIGTCKKRFISASIFQIRSQPKRYGNTSLRLEFPCSCNHAYANDYLQREHSRKVEAGSGEQ